MPTLTSIILKIIGAAALLTALWAWWDHDREAYAARKVNELRDAVRREAERDWQSKLDLYKKRLEASDKAAEDALSQLAQLEKANEEQKHRIADADRLAAGLRTSITAARRNALSAATGGACFDQAVRADSLAGLLEEGQRVVADLGEQLAAGVRLVGEVQGGAQRDAVMFVWARRVAEALRLGAEPPPAPGF